MQASADDLLVFSGAQRLSFKCLQSMLAAQLNSSEKPTLLFPHSLLLLSFVDICQSSGFNVCNASFFLLFQQLLPVGSGLIF